MFHNYASKTSITQSLVSTIQTEKTIKQHRNDTVYTHNISII